MTPKKTTPTWDVTKVTGKYTPAIHTDLRKRFAEMRGTVTPEQQAKQERALDEMVADAQRLGLYDD